MWLRMALDTWLRGSSKRAGSTYLRDAIIQVEQTFEAWAKVMARGKPSLAEGSLGPYLLYTTAPGEALTWYMSCSCRLPVSNVYKV
jgi:hypothetical protein